jgi:hypothetical protein
MLCRSRLDHRIRGILVDALLLREPYAPLFRCQALCMLPRRLRILCSVCPHAFTSFLPVSRRCAHISRPFSAAGSLGHLEVLRRILMWSRPSRARSVVCWNTVFRSRLMPSYFFPMKLPNSHFLFYKTNVILLEFVQSLLFSLSIKRTGPILRLSFVSRRLKIEKSYAEGG